MQGIMVDNDLEGHFEYLLQLLRSPAWKEFWDSLEFSVSSFESLGLSRDSLDSVIWQACQSRQIVLIIGNRNRQGPESLEATIRVQNRPESLPVITIGDAERFLQSPSYAERVVVRLLEYLQFLDNYRGTGRLYVP